MPRKMSEKQDLLGLVALGSLITNLAQADDKTRIQGELVRLRNMFVHLQGRYSQVCEEYARMRDLIAQLQTTVVNLRAENNRFLSAKVTKG